ncbi:class I adenylate-forming enzyme family protein [Paenibacillus sp. UNC499MF]|uniref:class I adenylate-forming enzyme family protein n=1 Tax=Paenibacillus sp. UNC499MF TaxID=1502751 RepID=UPI00089FDB7B|nr:class I adenylate-forming enzyme family protein [Paenibacillus sp. UNC499MF]SEG71405.1 Acyl-CoA synthetase (AMP-forming)/AMP-acid ligase II [Paenibacillus sp. UNC499MF]
MITFKPHPKTALLSSELSLSYAELNGRIGDKKKWLEDRGWKSCRVAIDLPDSYTLLEWTAANWQQRNHVLLLDQRMKEDEKQARLRLFSPDLTLSAELPNPKQVVSFFQPEVAVSLSAEDGKNADRSAPAGNNSDGVPQPSNEWQALTLFSSGSTGTPKSITRTYQSLLDEWSGYAREEGSPGLNSLVLCLVPLSHALGLMSAAMHTLLQGGTVAFPDFINGEEIVSAIERYEVSHVYGVAFHYKLMEARMEEFVRQSGNVRSGKPLYLISSGGPLPSDLAGRYRERIGLPIGQQYGMSEIGYISVDFTDSHSPSLGKISQHIRYEWSEEQPQLAIRLDKSPYADKQDNWITDPHGDGTSGTLYTQDLVHIDEHGFLTVIGRSNDQISIGGLKVTLQEIEAALREHPLIREAAAVHYEHPVLERVIEAFIVWDKPAVTQPLDDIIRWLRNVLSDYKIPKKLHVIEQLPLSAAGKLLRGELLKEHSHGTHR